MPPLHRRFLRPFVAFAAISGWSLLCGCGESTMRLESDMKMQGDMRGSMKIEGPIEMSVRMEGPSVAYEGVYISEGLLERVEKGVTRADWLLAVFGEPTARSTLDDGSEIWKWAYMPVRQQGSIVTLLSTGGGKDEPKIQTATSFVHLREGLVVETWRD